MTEDWEPVRIDTMQHSVIFLFTLFMEYMLSNITVYKINGLDFVAWISFAAWILVL